MQALERNLSDLHIVLQDGEKSMALLNPISIISDMNDFVSRLSPDDIGLCSSVLFHEEKGIFAYVHQSITLYPSTQGNKTMTLSRKAIFDFLLNYIKIARERILEQALIIKRWCVNVFRRESSNQVRLSTIAPLIKLLIILMENGSSLIKSSSSSSLTTAANQQQQEGDLMEDDNNNNNETTITRSPAESETSLNIKEVFQVYFKEFQRMTNSGNQSVKGAILHLLGVLCEYFPGETHMYQQQMLSLLMNTLLNQSKKAKPEPQLIASTFRGLSHFLSQFGGSVEEGSSYIKPLYQLICTSLELVNETRYDVPKAALIMISKHAYQFKEYLTVDAEKMFDRLSTLCSHRNDKVRKNSFPALESFLAQISYELVREGGRKLESNLRTFKNLMQKFKSLLSLNFADITMTQGSGTSSPPTTNPTFNKYYLSIAIRSFGQFALPMKKFLTQSDTKMILRQLMKLSDQLLTRSQEQLEESVSHIPSFLSAFANIILELDTIDSWILDSLEKISGILFLVYPKQYLFPKYRYANYSAFVKLLIALYLKERALSSFLDRIIFQSMTLTISSVNSMVSTNDVNLDMDQPVSLYEEYLDLWYNILNPKTIKLGEWNYPWIDLSFSEEVIEHLHSLVYDKIIEVIMQMISKFDLRCTNVNNISNQAGSTPVEVSAEMIQDALIPSNAKDMELFLNLIEFTKLFMKKCKPKHFIRWNYIFSKLLIEKSTQYSYISGFYKLLSVAMRISDRNFIDLRYFVHPLQLSFELGLSYLPLADIGLKALEHWIKVLPKKEITEKCLPKVLPKLNPYLMVKHNSSVGIGEENSGADSDVVDVKKLLKGQTKNSIRKINDDKSKSQNKSSSDQTPLGKVQLGVIRLLGKIGGDNILILNSASEKEADENIIRWDTEQRVKFSMPFRDVKLELYFDSILPRITELAEKSSDRQTKIAACEFLHSLVLYMVGKNAYSPQARQRAQEIQLKQAEEDEKRKKQDNNTNDEDATTIVVSTDPTPYFKIYEKIFPVLLRLSVDTEQVTKQLFEPLIFQLVHWLTQNMQYENKETMALLDAIIDSMSETTDGALRDQCSLLLNEFLKWSVKHDKDGKFINVKSLFQRLYSNIHHPNLFKRLGAIMAFNSMYKSFREVDSLVQRHVLDWLHNVIVSLKIVDNEASSLDQKSSENSLGLVEKTIQLIDHIERIIVAKSHLLIKENDRRIHVTLAHAVDWIFMQCGNGERICREQCMKLFPTLCMLLPGFDSDDGPRRWIHAKFKADESSVLKVVDVPSSLIPSYSSSIKVKSEKEEKKNVKNTLTTATDISYFEQVMIWLQKLEASFDCLYWLFNHKFLYPHQLFNLEKEHDEIESENKRSSSSGGRLANYKKRKVESTSDPMLDEDEDVKGKDDGEEEYVSSYSCSIMSHIYHFIEKFALKKPSDCFLIINTLDSEKFVNRKTSTTFRLLNFIGLILDKYPSTLTGQKVNGNESIMETDKFIKLLIMCILAPGKQGFNTNNEDVQTILPRYTRKIFEGITNYAKQSKSIGQTVMTRTRKILNEILGLYVQRYITGLDFKKSSRMNMDDYTFLFREKYLLMLFQISYSLKISILLWDQSMSLYQRSCCNYALILDWAESILNYVTTSDPTSSGESVLSKKLSQIDNSYQVAGDEGDRSRNAIHRVKPSTKGALFYKTFQSEIDNYISEHMDQFARLIIGRIASISNSNKRDQENEFNHHFLFDVLLSVSLKFMRLSLSKKEKKTMFVIQILDCSQPVLEKCGGNIDDDFKLKTMSLIERLFNIESSCILQHGVYQNAIIDFLLACLRIKRDDATSRNDNDEATFGLFDLKLRAIRILPILFKHSAAQPETQGKLPEELNSILRQVKSIVINEFPLNYEEIEPETSEYDDHISLLEDLLYAVQSSDSVDFLEQVLPLFRWKNHPLQEKMTNALKVLFGKFTDEKRLKSANICLETFYKESLPIDIRRQIIQWVCLTCLTHMPERGLVQFFEDNIQKLMKSIAKPTALSETISNPNIEELEADSVRALFVTRTCCYNLLEAMYRLLPASAVKEYINNKYCEKQSSGSGQLTGKELTEKVMRSSFAARSWKPSDQEYKVLGYELLLDFRTSAFNVLAGGVKCTQTQEKFYTGFLFKEKEEDLWENIIDTNREYKFEIETNFAFHRKAVDELRIDSNQPTSDNGKRKAGELRIGYLSSQYLSDSSLSSSMPFAGSFFIPGSKYSEEVTKSSEDESKESEKTPNVDNSSTLEMDEVNTNPCMASILRTVDHMVSIFKYPVGSDKAAANSAMPSWMAEMHKKLNNDETHRNIKLFLCKIITNRPTIFEPFSKYFFEPIIKFIMKEEDDQKKNEDLSSKGITYFIRDLIILLLKWKDVSPSKSTQGKELVSRLLAFMFKNCAHQKKVVLRSNLELVKLIVEKWKDSLTINKSIILGWICHDENKSTAKLARTTGLQLLGILLANDIPVFDATTDSTIITEEKFYEKILENISFKNKDVYEAASEICGMILKSLSKLANTNESVVTFERLLLATCSSFLQKMQYDRFLNCLYKIGIHDTAFIDHFLPSKILDILPNLYGVYKKIALQLITWRAEFVPDLYTSLKPFLRQNLQHKDEPTQLLTLQIIYQLLKTINKSDIMHFMEIMTQYINTSDVQMFSTFSEPCREKYYDILIWLFDNKPTEFRGEEVIRTELIKAMNDISEDIRKKMLHFWDHESRLSNESLKRLEQTFSLLYSNNLGDKWLQFSSYLLLQLLHRSPDFSDANAIFSESLSNCVFKEYKIDTSWQHKSLPLTATSIVLSSQGGRKGSSSLQSYASLPYESLALEDPYNTMSLSQSGGLIHNFLPLTVSNNSNSTSSGNEQQGTSSTSGGEGSSSDDFQTPYLRRRFLKLKETTMTQYQARRAVRIKKEKEAWETRQKIAKKNRITMYRKYRTGELPDIQISLKEIITPLQALCIYDVSLARHLFVSVFTSLYPNMEKLSEKQSEPLKHSIHTNLQQMLKKSPDSSLLVSALLSVILDTEDLQQPKNNILTPKLIRSVSMQSHNVELGILLLEHLIENNLIETTAMEDENIAGQDDMRPYIDAWIELGKLYKAIDEQDVIRSIFEYHVAQQENTKKALSDELDGRYNSALKIYSQGVDQWDSGWQTHDTPPIEEEVEFWRTQKLECLKKMNSWDLVLQEVLSEVQKRTKSESEQLLNQKIWEASELNENLLSLYLDSNLKQKDKWSSLKTFIEESMSSNVKREILETKYSNKLANLSLFTHQYEKAKSYVVDSYAEFLMSWSTLSPLAKTGRHLHLQRLQPLVEMEEFIQLWQNQSDAKSKNLIRMLKDWRSRYPSSYIDDMNTWDNVISNRNFMYDLISQNLENFTEKDTSSSVLLPSSRPKLRPLTSSLIGESPSLTLSLSEQEDYQALAGGLSNIASGTLDLDTLSKTVTREKAVMFLTVTKAARKQKNNTVAQSYLKVAQAASKKLLEVTNSADSSDALSFDFEFFKSLVKLLKIKALTSGRGSSSETKDVFDKLIKFIKQNATKYGKEVNDASQTVPTSYVLTYKLLDADANSSFANTLRENTKLGGNPEDYLQTALNRYKESVEIVNKNTNDDSNVVIKIEDGNNTISPYQSAKIYLKFAIFCDEILKERLGQKYTDDEDLVITREGSSKLPSNDILAEHIVENMLNSMKYYNKEARDRFPRLLELIEKFPSTRKIFAKFAPTSTSLQIPSWMFITWISQMLAHLTGPEGECLIPILLSLAENYPQSLYYPLNISSEDIIGSFERGNTGITRKVLEGIKLMKQKVRNPLIETFIFSLKKLNHPELRFKAYMDDIKEIMKSKNYKSEKERKRDIKSKWEEAFDDLFDPNAPNVGVYNTRFAKNWVPQIKKDFGGRDGAKVMEMTDKTFEQLYAVKFKKMKETKGAMIPGKTKLEYFSKWMFDFHQSSTRGSNETISSSSDVVENGGNFYIEVPGQYINNVGKAAAALMLGSVGMSSKQNNMQAPSIDEHVRIISFDPNLLTMSSMRKPKRLKIHGSDEKDYAFLVKGGEDLRQDQRIQQLFHVMNNILDKDTNCKQRDLNIRMYKVVPMSSEVGIIEWVDNTMPLKAIIEEQLNKQTGTHDQEVLKHPSASIHLKMLEKVSGSKGAEYTLYQKYLVTYSNADQDMLEQTMDEQYKLIDPDLLRNGLRSLAMSNEAYFTIRNRFAKSLATFSISSYVLGIGDRHLENFLVDFSEGSLIGIDFGHAFGSATEILPVPELMPFRLTRQMLAIFSPISTTLDDFANENVGTGLLFESMVHCMRALHNNRHILLNTMDVFIKEPLVDWLKNAKKNPQFYQMSAENLPNSASSSSSSEASQDGDQSLMKWYPQRKVELAKMKLELANPKVIFKSDAQANLHLKKGLKYVDRAIEGDPKTNKRAKVGETCSSIKEQVECLIDMATDVKILGRTYIGWGAQF
ncbi:DNA dependent protein kinase catalytic subunit [Naegleria gruberi]|uniref:DNA-dependent protein kinase catalytic subunit n=1 Tax=Naegleria gruberi TaxID=5762 RepID=D2V5J3_NAEGR|nr:DNA dependent protein kinase catalytic subunit [Naegleria gruberi]EFC47806.1 DNA dependent protein kinase catalytic subunit [Naegleria gruberi]|eukprot:XP_002680550.1 DNA dependent protein kinase catalytic subunit [Naegleria gruberi strain NEG-M]